ncbi:MAG: dienelactone hydrolase family protein [Segetibacter sp.]
MQHAIIIIPKQNQKLSANIKEQNTTYSADTVVMNGFVAYDSIISKKRPAIIVIPEWWGLNNYAKSRAKQLASLGYVAMAIDLYGNGCVADNPDTAEILSMPFYYNPIMAKNRFDAALARLKTYSQVDTNNIAAIGYCFGGAQVINIANLGEDLKGIVCFHGNVIAGIPVDKQLLKAKVLVCNGAADEFVKMAEIELFKKKMDSIGADYTVKLYPNATHAFTNPEATAMGKKFNLPIAYNAAADSASWQDMKLFLKNIFKL